MASQEVLDIIAQVQRLSPEQQRELIAELNSHRFDQDLSDQRPSWLDFEGILPYPVAGEDAQEYIIRTRREDDEHRQSLLPPEYRL